MGRDVPVVKLLRRAGDLLAESSRMIDGEHHRSRELVRHDLQRTSMQLHELARAIERASADEPQPASGADFTP